MKKPTLVIAAFAALVLAGCATTQFKPSKLGQLNLGMDKGEVLRLLGKPTQAATAAFVDLPSGGLRKKEALRYDALRRDPRQTNHFVVIYLEGKVTEYGPEVGRLASEMEGVFTEYPKEASATDSDQNRDAADEITENKHGRIYRCQVHGQAGSAGHTVIIRPIPIKTAYPHPHPRHLRHLHGRHRRHRPAGRPPRHRL